VGTHDAWVVAWGWAHPLRPRGAWAPSCSALVVLGLLPQGWAHP